MKKIRLLLVLLPVLSFICNLYLEEKLNYVFSEVKTKNITYLGHHSNKNFHQYGIENIGDNLQKELIIMDIDRCRFEVRRDYFYFFQNKVIYISNRQKCLKVMVGYNFMKSLFKVKSFVTVISL